VAPWASPSLRGKARHGSRQTPPPIDFARSARGRRRDKRVVGWRVMTHVLPSLLNAIAHAGQILSTRFFLSFALDWVRCRMRHGPDRSRPSGRNPPARRAWAGRQSASRFVDSGARLERDRRSQLGAAFGRDLLNECGGDSTSSSSSTTGLRAFGGVEHIRSSRFCGCPQIDTIRGRPAGRA